MMSEKQPRVDPRIIIHGGAGNITRDNLPEASRIDYRDGKFHGLYNNLRR